MSADLGFILIALAFVGLGLVASRKRFKYEAQQNARVSQSFEQFKERVRTLDVTLAEKQLGLLLALRRQAEHQEIAAEIAKLERSKDPEAQARIERLKKASQPN
jgi:hypothetical protein